MVKECPLCGEFMRLRAHETFNQIPGTSQIVRTIDREWVCTECDYFEEELDDSVKEDDPSVT